MADDPHPPSSGRRAKGRTSRSAARWRSRWTGRGRAASGSPWPSRGVRPTTGGTPSARCSTTRAGRATAGWRTSWPPSRSSRRPCENGSTSSAMDPRASARSTPVACDVPVSPRSSRSSRAPSSSSTRSWRTTAPSGESCLESVGPLLGHLDTVSVARDHDALRQALRVRQVSWLGISYGTQLAANYAELFPRRTRAMALDAALEHSLPEVLQVAGEIRTVEDSFNRFAGWCDTDATCALQRAGRRRRVRRARRGRRPVARSRSRVRSAAVTGEDIRMGTIGRLTFKEPSIYGPDTSWAGLSRALAGRPRR